MFYELIFNGLMSYKSLLTSSFPFAIIGLAITGCAKARLLFFLLIISTGFFQFVPSLDNLRESMSVVELDSLKKNSEIKQICLANQLKNKIKI
jgi:hypothetical protein